MSGSALSRQCSSRPRSCGREHPQVPPPRHDPVAIAEAGDALRCFDSKAWIGAIDVPVASVITTRERIVPAVRQAELAQATNATVHLVDGNHDVVGASPEPFRAALIEACDSVARRATRRQRDER